MKENEKNLAWIKDSKKNSFQKERWCRLALHLHLWRLKIEGKKETGRELEGWKVLEKKQFEKKIMVTPIWKMRPLIQSMYRRTFPRTSDFQNIYHEIIRKITEGRNIITVRKWLRSKCQINIYNITDPLELAGDFEIFSWITKPYMAAIYILNFVWWEEKLLQF